MATVGQTMMKASGGAANVVLTAPTDSVVDAARRMAEANVGFLPVASQDKLIGAITDRDITVRCVASGRSPSDCHVRDIMSMPEKGAPFYCFEDEDVDHVTRNMAQLQVRRLPVVDREKRLVGVLTVGDVAATGMKHEAGAAEHGIAGGGGGPML